MWKWEGLFNGGEDDGDDRLLEIEEKFCKGEGRPADPKKYLTFPIWDQKTAE